MTDLSNIFFGKKVVQKAYLNNALIYQSKGWQTLPSTCTEVWTKSYEKVDSIGAIVKDDSDNLYIGTSNAVYKFDSDGKLKWKCAVGIVTAIIVYPTYIYCSYYVQSGSTFGNISKIDVNGNLLSDKSVNNFMPTTLGTYFIDMQRGNEYIYAITKSHVIKLDSNLNVIDNVAVPSNTNCLATNNGPYVFVGTGNYGIRFKKDNLKNSNNLSNADSNFNATSIAMDNTGNLYLGSSTQTGFFKYDVETCKLITNLTDNYTFAAYVDSQENCYMVINGASLNKFSSDGTLIWDKIQIPASNSSIKVITDSNNNIYVAYIDSNGMLAIKKLINLVKEN